MELLAVLAGALVGFIEKHHDRFAIVVAEETLQKKRHRVATDLSR